MAERRWTFMVVPEGTGASRAIQVSQSVLRVGAIGLGLFVLLALVLGYATVSRSVDLSRAARLEKENRQLAATLGQMNARISTLADTLSQITQRDARIRLLANLEPTDPQVLQAGIGGPRPEGAATRAPRSELVRQATEVTVDLNAMIRRANLLAFSFDEAADSLESHRDRLAALPSILPTQGWLTSAFSAMREHPVLHVARPHEGIDVVAPMGAPIEAPAGGRVISAGWEAGYGYSVSIDHGYGITTRFAHASKLLVRKGQQVERGQRIALVGNTGLATGPHLHYEVHVRGRPVDPLNYVLPAGVVTD
ncbi:MAG TPA: M23 family metallopeptidase [Gemmatimonadales bacterium]|nr:M23 family metallopeptidase [Gemmatimonadales bacterium]